MAFVALRTLIPVAITAAILSLPAAAEASSCTAYPGRVLPNAATPDVPTNTLVWYAGQSLQHALAEDGSLVDCDVLPRLVDDAGQEVATTSRSFSFAYVLVPDAPLTLGRSYTIEHGCLFDVLAFNGGIDAETTTFTVTAEADETAPEHPDIAVGDTVAHEYDNGFTGYWMEVEGEHEGVLLVDIGGQATLDPEALSGEVSLASTDTDFVIGHACVSTWPDAQPGDSTELSFASFDLAGNFSGWTEPEPVTVTDTGRGCTVGAGRPPAMALGLLLLGLVGRRRRRR